MDGQQTNWHFATPPLIQSDATPTVTHRGPSRFSPGESVRIEPNYKRQMPLIDWAECGWLRTRGMSITPQGSDGLILFTGVQNRVLNVALYPDLPSHPNGNFSALLDHIVTTYQAANPDVLLNVVIADEDAIYSFEETDLPRLLGLAGYDVVELDTIYLGLLASDRDLNFSLARDIAPVAGVMRVPGAALIAAPTLISRSA